MLEVLEVLIKIGIAIICSVGILAAVIIPINLIIMIIEKIHRERKWNYQPTVYQMSTRIKDAEKFLGTGR